MIQIFSAHGRDGTGPTEGSTRGPRGPKNGAKISVYEDGVRQKELPGLERRHFLLDRA